MRVTWHTQTCTYTHTYIYIYIFKWIRDNQTYLDLQESTSLTLQPRWKCLARPVSWLFSAEACHPSDASVTSHPTPPHPNPNGQHNIISVLWAAQHHQRTMNVNIPPHPTPTPTGSATSSAYYGQRNIISVPWTLTSHPTPPQPQWAA